VKELSDEDLLQAYNDEMENFSAQEERRAAHIMLEITDQRDEQQTLEKAQEILARLNQGEDFAAVAAELSEDLGSAEQGGDLGYSDGETFPPAFEEALATLAKGEISAPVLTEAGIHLIKATEVKSADKPAFEDYKPALAERLQLASAEQAFLKAVEDLRDLVFNAEDLAGPAADLALTVQRSDWLDRNTSDELLAKPQVLSAVFSEEVLEDGNNSDVLELAKDHFLVLRVNEHKPVSQRPLAEVKDNIVQVLSAQQALTKAQEQANSIEQSVAAGGSIEAAAKADGYEWHIEADAVRSKPTLNTELLGAVFAMPITEGKAGTQQVVLSNGTVAVVQLDKVTAGDWSRFSEAEKNNVKQQLRESYGNQSLSAFVETVRQQIEVEVL
jgi:peptidyl-prolyl cis-trans isomerase D